MSNDNTEGGSLGEAVSDLRRRRVLQALGAGAALTAVGSGPAAAAQSSDEVDPNFGFTGLSPDAEPPVEPDHEVDLLIRPSEERQIPEFFFQPTGLFVEPGETVAFRFPTPDHSVVGYHSFIGRQQRTPDRDVDPGLISSPFLGSNAFWLFTFEEEGVYDLFCPPHEVFGMAMRVVVGEASGPGASEVPDPCAPAGESEGGRPPALTAALVLRDPALAPENVVSEGTVEWSAIAAENKQLFLEFSPPEVCGPMKSEPGDGEPEATAYQVDFVAGAPEKRLGEDPDDFYSDQDRLLRFLHGSEETPEIRSGGGFASGDVADCVDWGSIEVEHSTTSVEFEVADGCEQELSLASYVNSAGPGEFSRETAGDQRLFDSASATFGPGEGGLTVAVPGAPFVASLSGDNEVPPVGPVETDASGFAWFSPEDDGTWHYHLLLRNVEDVTQAHIHEGGPDENGPVVAFLAEFTGAPDGSGGGDSRSATHADVIDHAGTIGDTDLIEQIAADPGGYYVNVHTAANPPGEIRGQLRSTE
jgi:plastocyanin